DLMTRIRLGAVALAATGVLFLLYPAFRPWHDETTVPGAIASMTSDRWVASHLFAMIGFILMPLGLLALHRLLNGTRGEPLTAAAVVTSWIGAGLTLPYYGAEDFALHAVAQKAATNPSIDLLDLVDAVRFESVAATTFALGLLLLAVGAILAAVAIWRASVLPRASGIVFAVGFALFIPQFYLPAAARIAHGVLILIGSVWLAGALWRAEEPTV
ncbi:MAG TPA: hypothetical protein VLL08_12520, partial [Kineosporiaceae bacterium]|nr:hypothetical protein [Kineosporiaceae bacterium]